jgi:tryptophan halogenase
MKIKKVVIVGGGSSGWMTAAALCRQFPELEITLIESKDIKTIGVGESTLFGINQYLSLLNIEDKEWMPECDATYKVSISFTDFRDKGTHFQYPFGGGAQSNQMPLGLDCWPILRQLDKENNPLEKFAEFYNPITYLATKNRMTYNEDQSIPAFDPIGDVAYHFDSTKFGIYLRDKICKPSGLQHVVEEVTDITKKENGDVEYVITESGSKFEADLFVDCTGFKSLLLEETMGSKFISYSDTLLNDSALATKLEYDDPEVEMTNFTDCTAIENGWVWNIPLWNRIGSGYVYSSKFVDRDQALVEFKNHLKSKGKEIPGDAEILDIKIKHGRHDKAWIGNVIAIGLSYGFIEPLESTGLLTTHENIYKLVRILQRRDMFVSQIDKIMLNDHMQLIVDGFKSFLEIHYALSQRQDTEYWRYVTNDVDYDGNIDMGQLRLAVTSSSNFRGLKGGLPYIAAGFGYLPNYRFGNMFGEITPDDIPEFENVQREFEMFSDSLTSYIESLPTHRQFLLENIYS